jgi:hypothetical protein
MNYTTVALLIVLNQLFSFAETYYPFEENGKVGLKNQSGEVLIPARYEALGWSDEKFSVLNQITGYKQNNQWGLITIRNQTLTAADYFTLNPGSQNLLLATKRSALTLRISAGIINYTGKTVIPFFYSGIKLHSMRAIIYTVNDNRMKYGLIDLSNKILIPQLYKNIYPIGSLRYAVQNFDNKTALFSETGRAMTRFVIDSISSFQNGHAIIYQDGKQGLINREGKVIYEPIYREIKEDGDTYFGRLPDEWHVLEGTNKLLRKIEADSIIRIGVNRVKLVSATGTQLADLDFTIIGNEKVDHIYPFSDGLAVFRKLGKEGVIRTNGTVVLPAEFDRIQPDGGHLISTSWKSGNQIFTLYDTLGTLKSKKLYDFILPFNGIFFPVIKNGFYGGINKNGDEIIACAYDSLGNVFGNLTVARFRGRYGIINSNEQWIVLPQSNRIRLLNEDRYFEYTNDLSILKTMKGVTLYFTSNDLEIQNNRMIESVSDGSKWTINLNGQIIHREQPARETAEIVFPSTEGYRGIKRNGKYGFIDDQGRLRIANRYEGITPFHEGLAGVQIRGKWGFINKEDKIVIQPNYDQINAFDNGRAKVIRNGKSGLISNDGQVLLDFRYDNLDELPDRRIRIESGTLIGLADEHGNILLQPKYEELEDLKNGLILVKHHGYYGVVTLHGISTIPTIYEQLFFDSTHNRFIGVVRNPFRHLKL